MKPVQNYQKIGGAIPWEFTSHGGALDVRSSVYLEQNKDNMEKNKREKLENHIREKIEILKKDIISFKELTVPIPPDNSIGRLTRMEAISSKSINEAALRRTQYTLSKLERTLRMIDAPDLGLCRQCEEPILFARLMILPETDLCIECAEKMG
jgi:DnaK suppressor protein